MLVYNKKTAWVLEKSLKISKGYRKNKIRKYAETQKYKNTFRDKKFLLQETSLKLHIPKKSNFNEINNDTVYSINSCTC